MTPTLTPNPARAYQGLDQITLNRRGWHQQGWIHRAGCETFACYAGWICVLSGAKVDDLEQYVVVASLPEDARAALRHWPLDAPPDLRLLCNGLRCRIPTAAMALLGVDRTDAWALFDTTNSLDDMRAQVLRIFGPSPEVVPAVPEGAR